MHGFWKFSLTIGAVCGLATGAAACGPDPDDALGATTTVPASATFPVNGEQVPVVALDNNFLPQTLEVKAGTEVVFTNNGRNPHNVVPEGDPKATAWGALEAVFQPGDTYSKVFDQPGTYVYYCTIHGTPTAAMFGTINVIEP